MGTSSSCPTQFRRENIRDTIFGPKESEYDKKQRRISKYNATVAYNNSKPAGKQCDACGGSGRKYGTNCNCGDSSCACGACGGSGYNRY